MKKGIKLIVTFIILLLSLYLCNSTPCPQLCQTCTSNQCQSCYSDWTDNIIPTPPTSGICGCPVGYYMNVTQSICNFCPVECVTCTNMTMCTSCLGGYKLTNGVCLTNFTEQTIKIGLDLTNTLIKQGNAFGYVFSGAAATANLSNYFTSCYSMIHQPFIGYGAFYYDTVVTKTYYGVPHHQWALLKFQYFIIDSWVQQSFIVQIEGTRNHNSSTFIPTPSSPPQFYSYSSDIRNYDFCGSPQYRDNLGIFNKTFPHTDSILKFRIYTDQYGLDSTQLAPNINQMYFGIRQVLLIVGACPLQCQTCTSRSICLSCKHLYTLSPQYKCICDTNIAFVTSNGGCIENCISNIQYNDGNRCKSCGQLSAGCSQCVNKTTSQYNIDNSSKYKCIQCINNKILYNHKCVDKCPIGYYYSIGSTINSQQCLACPIGCLSCMINQNYTISYSNANLSYICQTCAINYIWYNGQCIQNCPLGTYLNIANNMCVKCMQNCYNCTSSNYCVQCKSNITNIGSPQIYTLINNRCYLLCTYSPTIVQNNNYIYNNIYNNNNNQQVCKNTTCANQCNKCFGPSSSQCISCNSPYKLQKYSCVSACSFGYYLQTVYNTINYISVCLPCPSTCLSCSSKNICTNCIIGYFLYNNQCIRDCPYLYYPSTITNPYICLPCLTTNCKQCIQYQYTVYNSNSQICIQCEQGYYLNSTTKTCVQGKIKCNIQYYYDINVKYCIPCDIGCQYCYSSLCYACSNGFVLNNGKCVTNCPQDKLAVQAHYNINGTVTFMYYKCVWKNPMCETYSIDNNCTECIYVDPAPILALGENQVTSQCFFSCPAGFSRSSTDSQLCNIICPTNCVQCDSQSMCIKCVKSFSIYYDSNTDTTTCVQNCPNYYISDSIQCMPCPANCLKCQQDGRCTACQNTLTLSPLGYCYDAACANTKSQKNIVNNTCVVCALPCTSCTTVSTECTSCTNNYVLTMQSTCVLVCKPGQFIDSPSKQCKLCRPTCQTCTSFQICTKCLPSYYLKSMSSQSKYCLKQCPAGTYISTVQPQSCQPCQFPCLTCFGPSNTQCLQCINGYVMDYTTCLSQCPSGKYQDEYGHCDLCDASCKQCYGPAYFQCSKCRYQYNNDDDDQQDYYSNTYKDGNSNSWFAYNGKCYQQNCPSSTYLSYTYSYNNNNQYYRSCKSCQIGCKQCISSYNCKQCKQQYILYNNICVQSCPYYTYYNSSTQTCNNCSYYYGYGVCQQCNKDGCTKCISPYYRYNKTCVQVCPTGYYAANHTLRQCLPCPKNCVSCKSPSQCNSCVSKYKMKYGICDTRKCTNGYYYDYWEYKCKSCSVTNCSTCYKFNNSGSVICTNCNTNYTLVTNTSGQFCVQNNNTTTCPSSYYTLSPYPNLQCQTCYPSCTSCSNYATNCTACKQGYILVNNLCIYNGTVPPTCTSNCAMCASSTLCIVCNLPYILMVNVIATPATAICMSQCPAGYYRQVRQCKKCAIGCQTCSNTANNCTSCLPTYYLIKQTNKCVIQCPDSTFISQYNPQLPYNGTCQSCSSYIIGCQVCLSSTQCTICQNGYTLMQQQSICYLIPNCPTYYYYQYQQQSCVQCEQYCKVCNSADVCTVCNNGYKLYNNSCINVCPTNTYQDITNDDGNNGIICTTCKLPCATCLSATVCVTCLPGYILSSAQQCILTCPLSTYPSQVSSTQSNSTVSTCQPCSQACLSCRINSTTCTSCYPGFYLYAQKCVADCPIAMYQSNIDNTCQLCPQYCLLCASSTKCLVCFNNMWLLNGQCINSCPMGYASSTQQLLTSALYNQIVNTCKQCELPCTTCANYNNQYQCLSCSSGYYLHNSRCLQLCPAGYFGNSVTSVCTQCPSWCLSCTSYTSCQTCTNSNCVPNCQLSSPSSCASCQSSCQYCDKSVKVTVNSTTIYGTCLQCYNPYILYNGRCVLTCPTSTYYNNILNICSNCSSSCSSCSIDGSCNNCTSTTYLYNGICYSTCPTSTIPMISITNNTSTNTTITSKYCIVNPCITSTLISSSSSSSTTNTTSIQCSYCLSPYVLYNKQCILACPSFTYYSQTSNTCQLCQSTCLTCNTFNNCTTCVSGYYLQANPVLQGNYMCVANCITNTYATKVNNVTMCVSCINNNALPNCQICVNNITCSLCKPSYVLHYNSTTKSTTCVLLCPSAYYPATTALSSSLYCMPCLQPTCLQCVANSTTNSYQCIACSNNTYLIVSLGICVSQCYTGYYGITTTSGNNQICTLCPTGCQSCSNSTVCISCSDGYILDMLSKRCVTTCAVGSYQLYNSTYNGYVCVKCNTSNGCIDCIYNSNNNINSQVCISCSNGYILLSGICYTTCPSMYYLSVSSYTCLPCSTNCLQCSSQSQCNKCSSGYTLNLQYGTCTAICSSSTYYHTVTQTCQQCSSQCSTCYGARYDQCISCVSPFVLYANTCVNACPTNYVQTISTCVICASPCVSCTGSGSAQQCTTCQSGMYLYITSTNKYGVCVKSCPLSTYGDPNTNQCITCSSVLPHCLQCTYNTIYNQPTCNICQSSYQLQQIAQSINTCSIIYTCPAYKQYLTTANICQACPSLCASCYLNTTNNVVQCNICDNANYYYNYVCYAQCPVRTTNLTVNNSTWTVGTQIYTFINICVPCPDNCATCTFNNANTLICQTCTSPYVLFQNYCNFSCTTVIYNPTTLKYQCSSIPNINCTSQGLYYYLDIYNTNNQLQCVSTCPSSFYLDTVTQYCKSCNVQCLTCNSNTACLTCKTGLISFVNPTNNYLQCLSTCPDGYLTYGTNCYACIAPCSSCTNSFTKCTSCLAGYLFVANLNRCVQTCPAAYYPSSTQCLPCPPQCLTCNSATACTACTNTYSALPTCVDNTTCPFANQYKISASTCAYCDSTCATCFGPSSTQCLSCPAATKLMAGSCIGSCINGYYTNNNVCVLCSSVIPNCAVCSYNTATSQIKCTTCVSPYLLSSDNSSCIQSCSSLNTASTLYTLNPTNNTCMACIQYCDVCISSTCYSCQPTYLLRNITVNNSIIQQCDTAACPTGTYADYNTFICMSCSVNCNICVNSTYCLACNTGYVGYNGQCVTNCPSNYISKAYSFTYNGVTYNYNNYQCMLCSSVYSNCITCSSTTNRCIQCVSPYLLSTAGECVICNIGYYYNANTLTCNTCNTTCTSCTNATVCTTCVSGLFMSVDGKCVTVCPTGSYGNTATMMCMPCTDTNCNTCTTLSCTLCQPGYYLVTSTVKSLISYTGPTCTLVCPSQTSPTSSTSPPSCTLCLTANCQSCPTISMCKQCLPSYSLTSSLQCVSVCPTGTTSSIQAITLISKCISCKLGCLSCNNNTNTCILCANNLINNNPNNGQCVTNNTVNCNSNQYASQISPSVICSPCDSTCLTCYGPLYSNCLSCSTGYALANNICTYICKSTQYYNPALTTANKCSLCIAPCLTCTSATICTSCISTMYLLTSTSVCVISCPPGTYSSNSQCITCPTYCATCTSQYHCTACTGAATLYFNSICYTQCPVGSYVSYTGSTIPGLNTCLLCSAPCLTCINNSTTCLTCLQGYYYQLTSHTCVTVCPISTYGNQITNTCDDCNNRCASCVSSTNCTACINNTYALYNNVCDTSCSVSTYQFINTNNMRECQQCSIYCYNCTSATKCIQCLPSFILIQYTSNNIQCVSNCPSGYILTTDTITNIQTCVPTYCANCITCDNNNNCIACEIGWYLYNGQCVDNCTVNGYYNNNDTWACTVCMDNCVICPNATYCSECSIGYNFSVTLDSKCVQQGVLLYGAIANISGFTSNITQVTSMVYMGTSAGPIFFGQMSSTYFNIQFCQFMFFHDKVSGNNSEMNTFLQSLNVMSMSSTGGQSVATSRRLLLAADTLTFLAVNVPIFIMMGAFLALYALTHLLHKYIDTILSSCPRFQFYMKQICVFLMNRFKWIYFDFVIWLSYLPFLYFSLMQTKNFGFTTAMQGVSSALSIVILATYPLYPLLIAYNIKKNYIALCAQNDKMVQMSLSPWVWKIKRPQYIPNQNDKFTYCTKSNWIFMYYPLKYFRKFIFVLVVVMCPTPIASLIVLISLNVIFLAYMASFRPRLMPYMIFDYIIQGVMLAFQIFMLIYVILSSVKITPMSIATHAFGFITANLSIIVAIILNIVAYYKIFMCIYELVQHLKQKMQQKQKIDAKGGQIIDENEHNNNQILYNNNQFIIEDEKQLRDDDQLTQYVNIDNLQRPQRDIANLLSDKQLFGNKIVPQHDVPIQHLNKMQKQIANQLCDKDLLLNNIQPRNDIDMDQLERPQRDIANLLDDKDLILNKLQPKNDRAIQLLKQPQRIIADNLTDKQLIVNNIQPRNDIDLDQLDRPQRQIANLLTDKDLLVNKIQPRYDMRMNQLSVPERQIANMLSDKDLAMNIQQGNDNMFNDNQDIRGTVGNAGGRGLFADKELFGDQIRGTTKGGRLNFDDQLPSMKEKKEKKKDKNKNKLDANNNKSKQNLNETSQNLLFKKSHNQQIAEQRDLDVPTKLKANKNREQQGKVQGKRNNNYTEQSQQNISEGTNVIKIQSRGKKQENSILNNDSIQSGEQLFSDHSSPDRVLIKTNQIKNISNNNGKQFTKIQVKQGKYNQKYNDNNSQIYVNNKNKKYEYLNKAKQSTNKLINFSQNSFNDFEEVMPKQMQNKQGLNKKIDHTEEDLQNTNLNTKSNNKNSNAIMKQKEKISVVERLKQQGIVNTAKYNSNKTNRLEEDDIFGYTNYKTTNKEKNNAFNKQQQEQITEGKFYNSTNNKKTQVNRNKATSEDIKVKQAKTFQLNNKVSKNFFNQNEDQFEPQQIATKDYMNQNKNKIKQSVSMNMDQFVSQGIVINKNNSKNNLRGKEERKSASNVENLSTFNHTKKIKQDTSSQIRQQNQQQQVKYNERNYKKVSDEKNANKKSLNENLQQVRYNQVERQQKDKLKKTDSKREIEQLKTFDKQKVANQNSKYKENEQQQKQQNNGFFSKLFNFNSNKTSKVNNQEEELSNHNQQTNLNFIKNTNNKEYQQNQKSRYRKFNEKDDLKYEQQIVRKQKKFSRNESNQKFSPNKGNNNYQQNKFQESPYSRRSSKLKQQLTQKLKQKANLKRNDNQNNFEEENPSSRKSKEYQEQYIRRGGKGALKIQNFQDGGDDLENIQL